MRWVVGDTSELRWQQRSPRGGAVPGGNLEVAEHVTHHCPAVAVWRVPGLLHTDRTCAQCALISGVGIFDVYDIFTAAGGTHDDWDTYDRVMREERRTAVLTSPTRTYSKPHMIAHTPRAIRGTATRLLPT